MPLSAARAIYESFGTTSTTDCRHFFLQRTHHFYVWSCSTLLLPSGYTNGAERENTFILVSVYCVYDVRVEYWVKEWMGGWASDWLNRRMGIHTGKMKRSNSTILWLFCLGENGAQAPHKVATAELIRLWSILVTILIWYGKKISFKF